MGNTDRGWFAREGLHKSDSGRHCGPDRLGGRQHFLVDWLWFSAIGYLDVFWIILYHKGASFHHSRDCLHHHPRRERMAGAALHPAAKNIAVAPIRVASRTQPAISTRPFGARTASSPVLIAAAAGVLGFLPPP